VVAPKDAAVLEGWTMVKSKRSPLRLILQTIVCTAMCAVYAGLLTRALVRDVLVCDGVLHAVPKPSGWRAWPLLPNGGGYHMHLLGLHTSEEELRSDDLCPEGGLSIDHERWPEKEPLPDSWKGEMRVHEKEGVFVYAYVAGSATALPLRPVDEAFAVAFRRETGKRLWFTSKNAMVLALALVVGLAGMLTTLALTWRAWRTAHAYRDPSRYKPGRRDATGAIAFNDGSTRAFAAGADGPVLVEVSGTTDGSFRVAPSTRLKRVLAGTAESLSEAATERTQAWLRRGIVWGIALGLMRCLAAGYFAIEDELRW
jgi:hypothetical protein